MALCGLTLRYNLYCRTLQVDQPQTKAGSEIPPYLASPVSLSCPCYFHTGFSWEHFSLKKNHLHRNSLLKVSFWRPQLAPKPSYFYLSTLQMVLSLLENSSPSFCPLGNFLSFNYHLTFSHCHTFPDHLFIKYSIFLT